MILALAIIAIAAIAAAFLAADGRRGADPTPEQMRAWEDAVANEQSAVGRILLNVARPFSRSTILATEAATPQWRSLQRKLHASGAFGSNVEIFLAVQVAAGLFAAMSVAFAAANSSSKLAVGAGLLLAGGLVGIPWNSVSKGAKRRTEAVLDNLPDFAELLLMPLAAGMGIPPALRFTAERIPGPVANEVIRMLDQIRVNPLEEEKSFVQAGERLGVPEARAFFVALLQAHIQGASVVANLARQAEALRTTAFQRKRSALKRLPIKLVLIIALHLLPLMFILGILPAIISLGDV
jgi:Flp pilus assembly protein TadB